MGLFENLRMSPEERRRKRVFNGQRPNDPDFGFSASNPVITAGHASSKEYVSKLRTIDGKPFAWEKEGVWYTTVHGVEAMSVEVFLLRLDGKEYKRVYICPWGINSSNVPQGLKLSDR